MSEPEFIPFHRASITDNERRAVLEVLDSGWLTTGPKVAEFEEEFGRFVGAEHAIAVNSGTAALHLAFDGLGIHPGDEVIVPTYTFAASAETVLYVGARPVLVDVDPATCNIDPLAVAAAVSPRTRAVEVVHIAGLPVDVINVESALATAAKGAGVAVPRVIEDAAHAFPVRTRQGEGRFAGTIGYAGAFSFYATKTITTGEGGMLTTDDPKLAERARSMRLHGISRDAWKRYTSAGSWYYEIRAAGFKDNMTDLAAALGLVQLERATSMHRSRAKIASWYADLLSPLVGDGRVELPQGDPGDSHAWHLYMLRLGPTARPQDGIDTSLPGVSELPPDLQLVASKRARVIEALRAAGIGTSVHFIPLHLHPLYREMGYRVGQFPAAERAYAATLTLPLWPDLTIAQVERIVDAIDSATH